MFILLIILFVIGKRGRVARAIRTVAQAAADEEGLDSSVEFID